MANTREHQDDPTAGSNDPSTSAPRPTSEVHRLRTSLHDNGERLEHDLLDAGRRFNEGAKKVGAAASVQIREHPLAAFGIAFAAGVVLSRLMRRR